jgi:integrase
VISFKEEQRYLGTAGANLRAATILAVDTGMRPKSELFRLEWPQVHLDPSEAMPNGYIKVREGKTQSAERLLPLTRRTRGILLTLRTEPYRKRGRFPDPAIQGTWSVFRNLIHEQSKSQGWRDFRFTAGPILSALGG